VLSNHALTFVFLVLWFALAAFFAWTAAGKLRPL
jgi:hypothetical protein